MTLDEAIEKARKLFALAQSDNPHEAAQAAARAQEILARFSIDAAMLETSSTEEPEEDIRRFNDPLDTTKNNWATWRLTLASVICKANQAKNFTSGNAMLLIGRPSDVSKVRYIYICGWPMK